MDYDSYQTDRREKLQLLSVLIVLMILVGILFYDSVLPGFAAIPLFVPAERIYSRERIRQRKKLLSIQFRDLLFSLSASFATGRHMADALSEAESEMSELYHDDTPMMTEIHGMIHQIRDGAVTDIQCWSDFAGRCRNEDIVDFVQAYGACRETGGNMISMMEQTSRIIGEKISIERDIEGMVAQKKAEGRIITVMPVVIILFLRMVSPEYLGVMYQSMVGRLLMTLALAATVFTYRMIERITDIEV